MKQIFTLLVLLFAISLSAQVGIGTITPRGALEIENANSGLLIPQIALSGNNDIINVVNPQGGSLVVGTMIYNTNPVVGANAINVGYVFWNGTEWAALSGTPAGASGWSLTGNATTATDFLGTTTSQPLTFQVNSTVVSSFLTNNTFAIGEGASVTNTNTMAVGRSASATGNNASALGNAAVASGTNALAAGNGTSSSGGNAVAIGNNTLATQGQTVAIGNNVQATAVDGVAIGNNSRAGGSQGVAIGQGAQANGSTSVAIGNGATSPNANTIVLGSSQNVGIGTNDPQARLQVNGAIRYQDGNQQAGRILTSDANGTASWQDPTASVSAYGQIFKNANTDGVDVNTPVNFGTNDLTSGTTLSATNIQTNGVTGLYRITYTVNAQRINGNNTSTEFILTQGFGVANKVAGSSTVLSTRGGAITQSVTKTVLVNVTSTFQQFYVFPAANNGDVRILPDSSLLVELVVPN